MSVVKQACASPWNTFTYTYPMNMKRKQAVVMRAPRLEGDNIPSMATTTDGRRGQVSIRMSVRLRPLMGRLTGR